MCFQKLPSLLFQEKGDSRGKLLAKIHPNISVWKARRLDPRRPVNAVA